MAPKTPTVKDYACKACGKFKAEWKGCKAELCSVTGSGGYEYEYKPRPAEIITGNFTVVSYGNGCSTSFVMLRDDATGRQHDVFMSDFIGMISGARFIGCTLTEARKGSASCWRPEGGALDLGETSSEI